MKKLCFCTTISATMKQFVLETARYLQQTEGFDITLICQDDPTFRNELPPGIRFRPVPMKRGMDLSGFAAVLAFLRIFRKKDLIWWRIRRRTPPAMPALPPRRAGCRYGCMGSGASGMWGFPVLAGGG